MLVRNRQVLADWERLLRNLRDICIRCWDHLANTPLTPQGDPKWATFGGQRLPQWQYEIDRGARVKVGIGDGFVVVVAVATGHPKENE